LSMSDISTTEPLSFRAGDKVQWKISDSDYPASDSYVLKYYLTKAGETLITLTAAASGADHLITIAAADSASYDPGIYSYQARIEKDTTKVTRKEGVIQVYRDISGDATGVTLTAALAIGDPVLELQFWMAVQANIMALLAGKALKDNQSYSIAGRSLSKYTPAELIELLAYIEKRSSRLKRKLGLTRGQKIQVQFS